MIRKKNRAEERGISAKFFYLHFTRVFWVGRASTVFGLAVSTLYVSGMTLTAIIRFDELKSLGLHEIGDFLAGVFAPLALLWLILGYFQQGKELRQNSDALALQARELHQAAEHAGGLLEMARKEHELALTQLRIESDAREQAIAREELARERRRKDSLQPRLSFYLAFTDSTGVAHIKIKNNGGECSEFTLLIPENNVLNLLEAVKEVKLKSHEYLFFDVQATSRLGTATVVTQWVDAEGESFRRDYVASVAGNEITIDN